MDIFGSNFFWFMLLALFIIAFQTIINYQKLKYSPDLILKFQTVWESKEARKQRVKAALAFKKTKKWDGEVETVLDILEDIGFYVKHDEISPEVAHHHFYHWARGYIQTASEYIKDLQRDDPSVYEYCEPLLKALSKVEAKKIKKTEPELHWEQKDIDQFIDDEISEFPSSDEHPPQTKL
jgi:lysyl-tRNA synthetase class II